MDEEFEFTYEVLSIRSDDEPGPNGAMVRYYPDDERCSMIEKFVPVPFQKARDKAHAVEILEIKISTYSPGREWAKECALDESGCTQTIGSELAAELGAVNESVDTTGSAGSPAVSQSGGSQGSGSGSDGGDQDEDRADHQSSRRGRAR